MSLVPWNQWGCSTRVFMDGVLVYLEDDTQVYISPTEFSTAVLLGDNGDTMDFKPTAAERIGYHRGVLDVLVGYIPFYVAVKQVMRRVPSELELRVYSML